MESSIQSWKRDKFIDGLKDKIKKKTHKFGVCVTRSVKEAHDIDSINKNSL